MRNTFLRGVLVSVVSVASLTVALALPANAADNGDTADTQKIGGVEVATTFGVSTQSQLNKLLLSSTPKVVTTDVASGQLLSVEAPPAFTTFGYDGTICDSTDLCLLASAVPYANSAFSGTGTFTGSWGHKNGARTGNRYGKLWWIYLGNTVENPKVGPNTTNLFNGVVTVTKVQRTTS